MPANPFRRNAGATSLPLPRDAPHISRPGQGEATGNRDGFATPRHRGPNDSGHGLPAQNIDYGA